jgi:hypothetical protein
MDGVGIKAQAGAITVEVTHPRGPGAVERLNAASLAVISSGPASAEGAAAPVESVRVSVDGRRHVVALWKSGDGEHGYRVMAQAFNASENAPRGAPVAISPIGADVVGPVSAASVDGHRVLAAFAASADDHFVAYGVLLRVP